MKTPAKLLVVDDVPRNVKLLADLLTAKGYSAVTASLERDSIKASINCVLR